MTECALCGNGEIENIALGLCGACAADSQALAKLVAACTENGNGLHTELRRLVEWQLCQAVAEFFGEFDEDGNWADYIGPAIEETGFNCALEQPDGSDPLDMVTAIVGDELWTVYLSDAARSSSDVCAYGVYVC